MAKSILLPQWATEFLNVDNAFDIECVKQPNGTVVVRKKRVPKCVDTNVVQACKDYVSKVFRALAPQNWLISIKFDKRTRRTIVTMTNANPVATLTGRARLNSSSEIYDAEVGIAIAMCRAVNGKHCDYQKIIGFEMA